MLPQLTRLSVALFISLTTLWSEEVSILKEKQLLEAELALSQKPTIYFIFHIKDKKIQLKARGILLKEWEMEKIRFWGNTIPIEPISLVKKSTLFPPKRERIKPSDTEEKEEFELQALELNDMPSTYTLSMEEGVLLYIRPTPRGLISMPYRIGHNFMWYTLPPLQTAWFSIKKESFTAFDIILKDKKDAQALYWAFMEGTESIVF